MLSVFLGSMEPHNGRRVKKKENFTTWALLQGGVCECARVKPAAEQGKVVSV